MYKTFFCLISIFILTKPAGAQLACGQLVGSVKEIKMALVFKNLSIVNSFNTKQSNTSSKKPEPDQKKIQPQFITTAATPQSFFSFGLAKLPNDFYNLTIGWACKQELKLEKVTTLPLRIRLGSFDQVKLLEGKN